MTHDARRFFDCMAWTPMTEQLWQANGTCMMSPSAISATKERLELGRRISWAIDKEGKLLLLTCVCIDCINCAWVCAHLSHTHTTATGTCRVWHHHKAPNGRVVPVYGLHSLQAQSLGDALCHQHCSWRIGVDSRHRCAQPAQTSATKPTPQQ